MKMNLSEVAVLLNITYNKLTELDMDEEGVSPATARIIGIVQGVLVSAVTMLAAEHQNADSQAI